MKSISDGWFSVNRTSTWRQYPIFGRGLQAVEAEIENKEMLMKCSIHFFLLSNDLPVLLRSTALSELITLFTCFGLWHSLRNQRESWCNGVFCTSKTNNKHLKSSEVRKGKHGVGNGKFLLPKIKVFVGFLGRWHLPDEKLMLLLDVILLNKRRGTSVAWVSDY